MLHIQQLASGLIGRCLVAVACQQKALHFDIWVVVVFKVTCVIIRLLFDGIDGGQIPVVVKGVFIAVNEGGTEQGYRRQLRVIFHSAFAEPFNRRSQRDVLQIGKTIESITTNPLDTFLHHDVFNLVTGAIVYIPLVVGVITPWSWKVFPAALIAQIFILIVWEIIMHHTISVTVFKTDGQCLGVCVERPDKTSVVRVIATFA